MELIVVAVVEVVVVIVVNGVGVGVGVVVVVVEVVVVVGVVVLVVGLVLVRSIMVHDLFEQGCKMQSSNADAHFCFMCLWWVIVAQTQHVAIMCMILMKVHAKQKSR
jgi:hypothetical protein